MPWRCPACQTPIRHPTHGIDDAPQPGVRYRCHICRLELIVDAKSKRLAVAPVDDKDRSKLDV